MFQCIIQQRNGWIHVPNQEFRDVNPGNLFSNFKEVANWKLNFPQMCIMKNRHVLTMNQLLILNLVFTHRTLRSLFKSIIISDSGLDDEFLKFISFDTTEINWENLWWTHVSLFLFYNSFTWISIGHFVTLLKLDSEYSRQKFIIMKRLFPILFFLNVETRDGTHKTHTIQVCLSIHRFSTYLSISHMRHDRGKCIALDVGLLHILQTMIHGWNSEFPPTCLLHTRLIQVPYIYCTYVYICTALGQMGIQDRTATDVLTTRNNDPLLTGNIKHNTDDHHTNVMRFLREQRNDFCVKHEIFLLI